MRSWISSDVAILDISQLRANRGGADDRTLAHILGYFSTVLQPVIEEAAAHAAGRRAADLERVAHAANGAARSACTTELADRLAEMEQAAHRADWRRVDRLLPAVRTSFAALSRRVQLIIGEIDHG